MFPVAVTVLLFVSLCLARPAEHELIQPGSLNSTDPVLGFPVEYLQIVTNHSLYVGLFCEVSLSCCVTHRQYRKTAVGVNSSNLTLPIDPGQHPNFRAEFQFGDRAAPRGIELVSSLATSIYHSWKDTANRRITTPYSERQQPFNQFYYQVKPSNFPRTSLTPLKVGLAVCEILRLVLTKPWWPASVLANMTEASEFRREQTVDIGNITIEYIAPYSLRPIRHGIVSPLLSAGINIFGGGCPFPSSRGAMIHRASAQFVR